MEVRVRLSLVLVVIDDEMRMMSLSIMIAMSMTVMPSMRILLFFHVVSDILFHLFVPCTIQVMLILRQLH